MLVLLPCNHKNQGADEFQLRFSEIVELHAMLFRFQQRIEYVTILWASNVYTFLNKFIREWSCTNAWSGFRPCRYGPNIGLLTV